MNTCIQQQYHVQELRNLNNNNRFRWYALTVTPVGKKVSMSQVIQRFKQITECKNVMYASVIPEVSPQGVNHLHGIIQVTKLNKFTKVKNLVLLTKNLYSIHGWTEYITKHHPTENYEINNHKFQEYNLINGKIQYCPMHIEINPWLQPFIGA